MKQPNESDLLILYQFKGRTLTFPAIHPSTQISLHVLFSIDPLSFTWEQCSATGKVLQSAPAPLQPRGGVRDDRVITRAHTPYRSSAPGASWFCPRVITCPRAHVRPSCLPLLVTQRFAALGAVLVQSEGHCNFTCANRCSGGWSWTN